VVYDREKTFVDASWKIGPWKSIYKTESSMNTDANSVPTFFRSYKSLSYTRNSHIRALPHA